MEESQNSPEQLVPKFARSELTLGNMVGQGGFSLVFQIARIKVDEVYDISDQSSQAREEVAKQARVDDGHPRFAIKLLRDDLMEEEHSKGVIDLAVEARLLKHLSHPNVVSMK